MESVAARERGRSIGCCGAFSAKPQQILQLMLFLVIGICIGLLTAQTMMIPKVFNSNKDSGKKGLGSMHGEKSVQIESPLSRKPTYVHSNIFQHKGPLHKATPTQSPKTIIPSKQIVYHSLSKSNSLPMKYSKSEEKRLNHFNNTHIVSRNALAAYLTSDQGLNQTIWSQRVNSSSASKDAVFLRRAAKRSRRKALKKLGLNDTSLLSKAERKKLKAEKENEKKPKHIDDAVDKGKRNGDDRKAAKGKDEKKYAKKVKPSQKHALKMDKYKELIKNLTRAHGSDLDAKKANLESTPQGTVAGNPLQAMMIDQLLPQTQESEKPNSQPPRQHLNGAKLISHNQNQKKNVETRKPEIAWKKLVDNSLKNRPEDAMIFQQQKQEFGRRRLNMHQVHDGEDLPDPLWDQVLSKKQKEYVHKRTYSGEQLSLLFKQSSSNDSKASQEQDILKQTGQEEFMPQSPSCLMNNFTHFANDSCLGYPKIFCESNNQCAASLFVIGAQKAGTTAMYSYFSNRYHPHIMVSPMKECKFYTHRFTNGIAGLTSPFPKAPWHILRADISPLYLNFPWTPQRIKSLFPDARFVMLLRDPLERAFSSFSMIQQLLLQKNSSGLSSYRKKVVEMSPYSRARFFDGIFEEEVQHISKCMPSTLRYCLERQIKWYGMHSKDENLVTATRRASASFTKFFVQTSLYSIHLKRWFRYFPKSHFLFIKFDDFVKSPAEQMERIVRWYGLDPSLINNTVFDKMSHNFHGAFKVALKTNTHFILEETKIKAEKFFKPYDDELEKLIGIRFYK